MGGLEEDTIGGFNSMLEKQQKERGDIVWTTVLFDSSYEVIHDRIPIDRMKPLTHRQYYVRGMTALLDAVGTTIHNIKEVQKADKSKAPDRTLFVITTDGYENSSVEYSYDMVREMVQRQQEVFDWEFIFLGANIDAVNEGGRLGIRASQSESEGLSGIAPEELKTSTTGYMMFLSLIQFVQQGHEIRNQTQQTQDDRS